MKDKNIYIIIVVLLLLGGLIYIYNGTKTNSADPLTTNVTVPVVTDTQPVQNTTVVASTTVQVKTDKKTMNTVILKTNKGDIELELNRDKAPITVENFTKLASSGFYNNIRFHRVIAGFMIQAGDPLTKDLSKVNVWGTGGPGYNIKDEIYGNETYPQGTLAMANTGAPNSGGSQFFIVTADMAPLSPSYTVFGKVVKGMDVALAIEKVARNANDRPLDDVIILNAIVK